MVCDPDDDMPYGDDALCHATCLREKLIERTKELAEARGDYEWLDSHFEKQAQLLIRAQERARASERRAELAEKELASWKALIPADVFFAGLQAAVELSKQAGWHPPRDVGLAAACHWRIARLADDPFVDREVADAARAWIKANPKTAEMKIWEVEHGLVR